MKLSDIANKVPPAREGDCAYGPHCFCQRCVRADAEALLSRLKEGQQMLRMTPRLSSVAIKFEAERRIRELCSVGEAMRLGLANGMLADETPEMGDPELLKDLIGMKPEGEIGTYDMPKASGPRPGDPDPTGWLDRPKKAKKILPAEDADGAAPSAQELDDIFGIKDDEDKAA